MTWRSWALLFAEAVIQEKIPVITESEMARDALSFFA